jgi:hypothetical protein
MHGARRKTSGPAFRSSRCSRIWVIAMRNQFLGAASISRRYARKISQRQRSIPGFHWTNRTRVAGTFRWRSVAKDLSRAAEFCQPFVRIRERAWSGEAGSETSEEDEIVKNEARRAELASLPADHGNSVGQCNSGFALWMALMLRWTRHWASRATSSLPIREILIPKAIVVRTLSARRVWRKT